MRNASWFFRKGLVCTLTLSLLSFPAWCAPVKFEIRDLTHRNVLAFISDALLEKIIAQFQLVKGYVLLDPENLSSGIQGEMEVDLRTLLTGSQVRDVVIQEQVLDSRQYPSAFLKVNKWAQIVSGKLIEGQSNAHSVEANLSYRGKDIALTLPLKITYFKEGETTRRRLPGNLLKVSSEWDIELSQLGITLSDSLKPLITKKVQVAFDGIGTDKLPNEKVTLPEGPKPKERESSSSSPTQ